MGKKLRTAVTTQNLLVLMKKAGVCIEEFISKTASVHFSTFVKITKNVYDLYA